MAARKQVAAGPRTPLNRDRVLRAAVDLADETGIDALTMRGLGKRLGVEAMSLYNHVANKDDLLAGMADSILSEVQLAAEGVDWKTATRSRAIAVREMLVRHPWAAILIGALPNPGPATLAYIDSVLGSLIGAGFTADMASRAFWLLDSYVYGFARQQSNVQLQLAADPDSPQATRDLPADTYPHLVEAAVSFASGPGWDVEGEFEFGLGMMLDGLERRMTAQ
jgi:AcrR family transcriptional regulator